MPLEKTLGVPLVLHGKAKTLTCQYVYDAILPTVREYLWNSHAGSSSSDEAMVDGNDENQPDQVQAKTQNVPAEIHVMQNGKSLMLSDEEKVHKFLITSYANMRIFFINRLS